MTVAKEQDDVDHYEVLGLASSISRRNATTRDIKAAYRRTLLLNHPDKSTASSRNDAIELETYDKAEPIEKYSQRSASVRPAPKYSVDEITLALKVLSSPSERSKHDRHLLERASRANQERVRQEDSFRTGFETVDLDDMEVDEDADGITSWYRACRCGDDRGFYVTEHDLEIDEKHGMVITGCKGCSLWLRIVFEAVQSDTPPT
ncbi:MAG: hypothetical protein M1825_000242 [Sarcosagium campestre]|nr:MAG: hypothetical protein M1825_000242 [Sarcosagium campestre]